MSDNSRKHGYYDAYTGRAGANTSSWTNNDRNDYQRGFAQRQEEERRRQQDQQRFWDEQRRRNGW